MPTGIADAEKVIRTIKTPVHFANEAKGRLKWRAFSPNFGTADVSVLRHFLGDDISADQAKFVTRPHEYAGLAVVLAGEVRAAGSTVVDERNGPKSFCGHAHINHGVCMPPKGETLDPELMALLKSRCERILEKVTFHADSADLIPGWQGSTAL